MTISLHRCACITSATATAGAPLAPAIRQGTRCISKSARASRVRPAAVRRPGITSRASAGGSRCSSPGSRPISTTSSRRSRFARSSTWRTARWAAGDPSRSTAMTQRAVPPRARELGADRRAIDPAIVSCEILGERAARLSPVIALSTLGGRRHARPQLATGDPDCGCRGDQECERNCWRVDHARWPTQIACRSAGRVPGLSLAPRSQERSEPG